MVSSILCPAVHILCSLGRFLINKNFITRFFTAYFLQLPLTRLRPRLEQNSNERQMRRGYLLRLRTLSTLSTLSKCPTKIQYKRCAKASWKYSVNIP